MPRRPIGESFSSKSNNRSSFSSSRNDHRPTPHLNNGFGGLGGGLLGGLGSLVGTAIGSAVGQAVQPAVNNIGQSVASSIGTHAQATMKNAQANLENAQAEKIRANKTETTSFEYFDECPYCGAPREGNATECEYCGTSLIKNTETVLK